MVFAREVNGRELTFGVSGKLIMNAVVLYDHQTDTLWSQFLAQGVDGPMAGTKMELLSSRLTTWEAWVEEHPDTLLLDRSGGLFGLGGDRYASYYASQQTGILGQANDDSRLLPKELVVGLDSGPVRRAYALSDLADDPIVNDSYDGLPILVAFDPQTRASAVFSRDVGGRALRFAADGPGTMRDLETGTSWQALTGEAIDGPLAGHVLDQQQSFVSFWFAWSDFYPDTEVYTPGP